jgi:hypothetical protein
MSTQVHATPDPTRNQFAVGGVESRHASEDAAPIRSATTRKQVASRSSARPDCNSISSARRNGSATPDMAAPTIAEQRLCVWRQNAGSTPAALGNPLHILSHTRAMMIEQIMAVDERTPARRRQLMAMSDEELNAEYREVVE